MTMHAELRRRIEGLGPTERRRLAERVAAYVGTAEGARRQLKAAVMLRPGVAPDEAELRTFLPRRLPPAMLPAVIEVFDQFPLLPNGKVDRRAVAALFVGTMSKGDADGRDVRLTEEEATMAEIWKRVLAVDRVERDDDFFSLGGDSLAAMRVLTMARQQGVALRMADLFARPTIRQLCKPEDRPPADVRRPEAKETGPLPLTPIQHWFFGRELPRPEHWNQSLVVEIDPSVSAAQVEVLLGTMRAHHEALRLRVSRVDGQWIPSVVEEADLPPLNLLRHTLAESDASEVDFWADRLHAAMSLESGTLIRAAWLIRPGRRPWLLLVVHHLAVDAVSWQMLLDDLTDGVRARRAGQPVVLATATDALWRWTRSLRAAAQMAGMRDEVDFWIQMGRGERSLPLDHPAGTNSERTGVVITRKWDADRTATLRDDSTRKGYGVPSVLLAALARVLQRWTGRPRTVIGMEGHGREDVGQGEDILHTLGWHTAFFPLALELREAEGPETLVPRIDAELAAIPRRGIGYGLLRYLRESPDEGLAQIRAHAAPAVIFNFLGQRSSGSDASARPVRVVRWGAGVERDPAGERPAILEINAWIDDGALTVSWSYSRELHEAATIEQWASAFADELGALMAERGDETSADAFTPCDLDAVPFDRSQIEAAFPLTPAQTSLLMHHLQDPAEDRGFLQIQGTLVGALEPRQIESAWQHLGQRHAVLRTTVHWEGLKEPVQVVHQECASRIEYADWTHPSVESQADAIDAWLDEDRRQGLALDRAPVTRLAVFRVAPDRHRFVWSCHHLLLDGWSGALLLREFISELRGEPHLASSPPFSVYCRWLRSQALSSGERFWKRAFEGMATVPRWAGRGTLCPVDRIQVLEKRFDGIGSTALESLARALRTTPGVLFLGAWALALSAALGKKKVVIGVTLSGRSAPIDGIEHMMGMFAQTLPFPVAIPSEMPLRDFLAKVARLYSELLEWEWCGLAEIHSWSGLPAAEGLFDHMLGFARFPAPVVAREEAAAIRLEDYQGAATSASPVVVNIVEDDPLILRMEWDPGRMNESRLAGVLLSFGSALRAMLEGKWLTVGEIQEGLGALDPALEYDDVVGRAGENVSAPLSSRAQGLVLRVWEKVFGRRFMSAREDFFAIGGTSLMAAKLTVELGKVFGKSLPINTVFRARTVEDLARLLERETTERWPIVLSVKPEGNRVPLFLVHEMGGSVFMYEDLAPHLDAEQPLFALQPPLKIPDSVEAIAECYIEEIRARMGGRPFAVGGYCFGAAVSLCIADKLRRTGRPAAALVAIDFMFPKALRHRPGYLLHRLREDSLERWISRFGRLVGGLRTAAGAGGGRPAAEPFDLEGVPDFTKEMIRHHQQAIEAFVPPVYEGDMTLIRSKSGYGDFDPTLGWNAVVKGRIQCFAVEETHADLMKGESLKSVARLVSDALQGT